MQVDGHIECFHAAAPARHQRRARPGAPQQRSRRIGSDVPLKLARPDRRSSALRCRPLSRDPVCPEYTAATNVLVRTPAEILALGLRLPNAAPQTRIVSVARIRLDPGNLSELSKGYFATTFLSSSPTTSASQSGLHRWCLVFGRCGCSVKNSNERSRPPLSGECRLKRLVAGVSGYI